MFNIPPNIFNRFQAANQMPSSGTYTATGKPYSGPFGNNTGTPFRTVAASPGGYQPAYSQGLNNSAAQLFQHSRGRPGQNPVDDGLYGAGAVQSFDDFNGVTQSKNGDLAAYIASCFTGQPGGAQTPSTPATMPDFDMANLPNIFNTRRMF